MDAVYDVLDTKVDEKPLEDLKYCVASLTKGISPGTRFDDVDWLGQSEADVELLGWEECAENMSFRVDKAWRIDWDVVVLKSLLPRGCCWTIAG